MSVDVAVVPRIIPRYLPFVWVVSAKDQEDWEMSCRCCGVNPLVGISSVFRGLT